MFNQNTLTMKKLFTFLMAMVITSMVFGQFVKTYHPIAQPIQDSQDRTGWVGGDADFRYFYELVEGEKIAMRLPAAGALPAGNNLSVTKVSFRWQTTMVLEDAQGNEVTVNCDPNFRILIYAGGNGDWIDQELCLAGTCYSADTTVQGNLLYSQTCVCSETGWQMVDLTEPVAIPSNQEVWIAIQALGHSCTLLAPDVTGEHTDWWGQYLDFFNTSSLGYIWYVPAFGETAPCITAKYALKALIDNGEAYVNSTDWLAQMYSLDSYEDQEAIESLYIDNFMMNDSLYLAPALWNMGPDSNLADGKVSIYIENTDVVILDTNLSVMMPNEDVTFASLQGVIFKNMGGLLAFRDMEDLGLTFPFNVCISYESFGYDPVTSNNTACAEITDVEPDGISENMDGG